MLAGAHQPEPAKIFESVANESMESVSARACGGIPACIERGGYLGGGISGGTQIVESVLRFCAKAIRTKRRNGSS